MVRLLAIHEIKSTLVNYRGSYRHLVRNAKAAMLAAIEIYNKPRFAYRDECCVILLLNSWELILKALLSRNGRSIFYLKRRGEPYGRFLGVMPWRRRRLTFQRPCLLCPPARIWND